MYIRYADVHVVQYFFVYSIGKSVHNHDLWVMEISSEAGVHEIGKPEVKFVSGLHGNMLVPRELLIQLVQYLCDAYRENDVAIKSVSATSDHPTVRDRRQ